MALHIGFDLALETGPVATMVVEDNGPGFVEAHAAGRQQSVPKL